MVGEERDKIFTVTFFSMNTVRYIRQIRFKKILPDGGMVQLALDNYNKVIIIE